MINSLGSPLPLAGVYAARYQSNAFAAKSRIDLIKEDEARKPRPVKRATEEEEQPDSEPALAAQPEPSRYEPTESPDAKLAALESEMDDLLTSILAHRI